MAKKLKQIFPFLNKFYGYKDHTEFLIGLFVGNLFFLINTYTMYTMVNKDFMCSLLLQQSESNVKIAKFKIILYICSLIIIPFVWL